MMRLCIMLACMAACSSTQHPWPVRADASLSVAAHALNAADQIAAHAYAASPRIDVAALDARFDRFARARETGRTRLIAAERALAGGGCDAVAAVRLASLALTDVGESLDAAGIHDATAIAEAVGALATVVASSGLVCP